MATDSTTAKELLDASKCLECIPSGLLGYALLQATLDNGSPTVTLGDVTLSVNDLEIGAVEIKDATSDTRAVVRTTDPDAGDAGIVVRIAGGAAGGGLTDAQLRASPVPISGTITGITNPVAVTGTFFQVTQPVSIAAAVSVTQGTSPWVVSGTVTTGGLTDAQLRATPVPISGSVTANAGTNLNTSLLALEAGGNLAGIFAGVNTLHSDYSITNSFLGAIDAGIPAGLGQGTMATSMKVVIASDQSAVPVTGTFFQATQPVSVASLPLPTGAATFAAQTNKSQFTKLTDGTDTVNLETFAPGAYGLSVIARGTGTFVVQSTLAAETTKVIGTVNQGTSPWVVSAASLPLPTGAATSAAQTDKSQYTRITDGTLTADVEQISIGLFALKVKCYQATSPWVVSGTVTTGGLTDAQLRATPVPVSGTLTTAEAAPTTIFNGKTTVTTAGTRVVLAASTTVKSVTIKALAVNTGIIYVGNATVSAANGFELSPGQSVSMDIANLNTVNIDSSVSGESVTYLGVN